VSTPERDRLVCELSALLPRRVAGAAATVLGAGNDDLEAGRRFLRLLAPGGYLTPTWPVERGGLGLEPSEADVVRSVLAEFDTPDLYPFMIGVDLVGPTLLAHATPEQCDRWLEPIRTGEEIWCQLFSEPDAGSDLANLKARARREGDTWRLSGSKVWSSRAHYADWGLLLARTDGSVPKHRGITAFGLDMSLPGITVRPLVQMNGDAHFNEVFFDDVSVPDADRIDQPGAGWRVAMTCLSHERGALAGGLGVSEDQVLGLGRHPGVAGSSLRRDRLVRDLAGLRIGSWSASRALAERDAGRPPGAEGSLAKLRTNGVLKDLGSLGVEAGAGEAWERLFLLGPSLSIRGGTDEIQRTIIAERALGLPPEPRVDKDRPFDQRPDA
jgi:alkylation response protein AidB-like acyl-CoA dehydrogenase